MLKLALHFHASGYLAKDYSNFLRKRIIETNERLNFLIKCLVPRSAAAVTARHPETSGLATGNHNETQLKDHRLYNLLDPLA
jgi:hypothetical protein